MLLASVSIGIQKDAFPDLFLGPTCPRNGPGPKRKWDRPTVTLSPTDLLLKRVNGKQYKETVSET